MAQAKKEAASEKKIAVKVKDIPVRYNDEDYQPGQVLEIEEKHFNKDLFSKDEE